MSDYYNSEHSAHQLIWLKRWIWIYFWLLIFEGVLRKWVVPSLSGPLLIVRDPIVLIVYFQAYRCHRFSMKVMWPFAFLAIGLWTLGIIQVLADTNTVPIALYGLRSYVLHLPLVLVMANTLTAEDIRKFGRWLLIVSIPMTVLMVAQYSAPGSSWINAGAGEGTGQIGSAGAHVRAAGTFSFVSGIICFVPLVAGFVVYAFTRSNWVPRWIVWLSAVSVIAAVPLSGSRTVLFMFIPLVGCVLISAMAGVGHLVGVIKITVVLLLTVIVALQLPFVDDAVATFERRWQQASNSEGDVQGVLDKRFLGIFESGIDSAGQTPLLGEGIGMGSNFAAVLQTGSVQFLLAETEWPRVVNEFGPVFGLLFMGLRVLFAAYIVERSIRALQRNDALAWFLLPGTVALLVLGVMELPTYLGFMVISAGLCLASSRESFTVQSRSDIA